MPMRSLLRTSAPHLRITVLAVLVLSTSALPAVAQVAALPACDAGLGTRTTSADHTWRTVVDVAHAFALRLPPGHAITGGDGVWYVHGVLDGAPLVPDVAISILTGATIDEVVARDFPAGARLEPIALGPATSGARVDAAYAAPDGTAYRQVSYLAATERGVLRVDRYEGFAWDDFDAVACSLHVVEVVE